MTINARTPQHCPHADLPPTGVTCPACRTGTLEVARGRFGPIYRCTEKNCGHWLAKRPTGQTCHHEQGGGPCGALMVVGTKTIPDRCSNRQCPNRHPHKLATHGRS